jgi:ketosteroid isomerase-like protein
VTPDDIAAWIAGYERAWRTPGTAALAELFAPDATYSPAPFAESLDGLKAIAEFWEAERDGPDEVFTLAAEIVAVDGRVGVARLEVRYGAPLIRTYRDLWVVTLDADGRCTAFEEWPFFPDRPRVAP